MAGAIAQSCAGKRGVNCMDRRSEARSLERLPPRGSSRRSRVRESACIKKYVFFKQKCYNLVAQAPSTAIAVPLPLGGRLFVSSIITQIGRENKLSADIYMCIRRGDLRSPAGEHSSPLPCSENILMRTLLTCEIFVMCVRFRCTRILQRVHEPLGEDGSCT